jgi:hypothetical protein
VDRDANTGDWEHEFSARLHAYTDRGIIGLASPDVRSLTTAHRSPLDQFVSVAEGFGFSCYSRAGSIPGDPNLYQLVCSADISADGYSYSVTAGYWAFDRISAYNVTALSLGSDGNLVHVETALTALLTVSFPPSEAVAVTSWFVTNVENPACGPTPCAQTFEGARADVTYGENGARALNVYGTAAAP